MSKPEITTTYDLSFFEEIIKQTGTQAALIAGFTFTILKDIPFNGVIAYKRCVALLVLVCATIGLELLSVVISGFLAFITKADDEIDNEEIYELELGVAYFSHLIGIGCFLASVILFITIKYPSIAMYGAMPLLVFFIIGLIVFIRIGLKNSRTVGNKTL